MAEVLDRDEIVEVEGVSAQVDDPHRECQCGWEPDCGWECDCVVVLGQVGGDAVLADGQILSTGGWFEVRAKGDLTLSSNHWDPAWERMPRGRNKQACREIQSKLLGHAEVVAAVRDAISSVASG